jgi:CRISPR-associated protein Cas2
MFYLVCFDIVDDKTRYQAVKVLKRFGVRVQKSVFECPNLTEERYLKLKLRLEDCIDHGEDTVRYYALCRDCVGKVEFSGTGEAPNNEKFTVV